MDSDLQHQQFHHHFQGLQRQMNTGGGGGGGGGLTRFHSAPTSYFSALMDTAPPGGAGAVNLPPPRPLSPDTESFLAQFMQSVTDAGEGGLGTDDAPAAAVQPDFAVTVKQETDQNLPSLSVNNSSNQMSNYRSSSKPPLARRSSNSFTASSRCGMESELRVPSVNFLPSQMKMETGLGCGRNASSLSRFNSSPAGLFDDLIIENGYLVNKTSGPETYGSNNKSINDEMNLSTANTDGSFIGSFPAGSWDEDSSVLSDQLPKPEIGVGELDPSENENQVRGEGEKRPWEMLAHHLSLPKASLEKLMQLQQDSVPCQMRAKRGCATHPRSIAERVRRTKISERMRKLQDLVPNMDKVINSNYSRLQKAQVARIDFPKFDGERVRLLEKRGEIMDDPMAELRNLQETEGIESSRSSDSVRNTAAATFRQTVALIFDHVAQAESLPWNVFGSGGQIYRSNSITGDVNRSIHRAEEWDVVSSDPSLRRETLSEVGKLGLHLLEDLTAIAAGGSATWLHVSSIQRSFALDILEFVLSNYVPVFRALIPYEQVLRHQICSLLMTSIRTNVELEGEVGEPSFRRLVLQSVVHIIRLYSSSLITECEVFLSMLVKLTALDLPLWHRILVLEALRGFCVEVRTMRILFQNFDITPGTLWWFQTVRSWTRRFQVRN